MKRALLASLFISVAGLGVALAWPYVYGLQAQQLSVSKTGSQWISLSYASTLANAKDLITDVNTKLGSPVVVQVCRYVTLLDIGNCYTGTSGVAFPLTPPEGYLVQVNQSGNYTIDGPDVPNFTITLDGPGTTSKTGTHLISVPDTATTSLVNANGLINLVGPTTVQVCRFVKSLDIFACYTGTSGTPFPLTPGDAYGVQVSSTATFTMP